MNNFVCYRTSARNNRADYTFVVEIAQRPTHLPVIRRPLLDPISRTTSPSSTRLFESYQPLFFCNNSADLLGPLTGTPDMTPAINIRPGSKDPVPAAPQAEFLPKDDYNVKLVNNVGPTDYVNPEPLDKYDMVSETCTHVDFQGLRQKSSAKTAVEVPG